MARQLTPEVSTSPVRVRIRSNSKNRSGRLVAGRLNGSLQSQVDGCSVGGRLLDVQNLRAWGAVLTVLHGSKIRGCAILPLAFLDRVHFRWKAIDALAFNGRMIRARLVAIFRANVDRRNGRILCPSYDRREEYCPAQKR